MRMNLVARRKLARLSIDIDFMIEDGDSPERIDKAIQEILDNDDFSPQNHKEALRFYLYLLPRLIENYKLSNQERIGSYIDYLMKEEGLGIDLRLIYNSNRQNFLSSWQELGTVKQVNRRSG